MEIINQKFPSEFIENNIEKSEENYRKQSDSFERTLPSAIYFLKKKTIVSSATLLVFIVPYLVRITIWQISKPGFNVISVDDKKLISAQQKIKGEIAVLDKKISGKTPVSYYLVINSASNEFSLYKGGKLIRTDKCSTGSYILLKSGKQQQWMFKTPKGEFVVQYKTTSPVWKKPDWAFIEEGLPVPSANDYRRYEYGVLGDYALSLGHGYLIHGTLYQRFLGLPVTHGCIRLNDENLDLIYHSLQVGSKVYIY